MKQTLIALVVSIAVVAAYHFSLVRSNYPVLADGLETTEIRIVDEAGVVRLRAGANLPDAVIGGKTLDRGGVAAGVLLYDASGNERSGYVTMDPGNNVMLTLDSRTMQTALFAAGPDGGSTLRLWQDDDAVEMRVDGSGGRITAVKDGVVLLQEPIVALPREACYAYRAAIETLSEDNVLAACTARFISEKCKECLVEYTSEQ
jgi:hypothetical protein